MGKRLDESTMIEPKKVFRFRKAPTSDLGSQSAFIFTVPEDLPYFDGHFPGNPVLPAVAIIDASFEAIRQLNTHVTFMTKIQSAKFMDLIRPAAEVLIELQETKPGVWSITWKKFVSAAAEDSEAKVHPKLADLVIQVA